MLLQWQEAAAQKLTEAEGQLAGVQHRVAALQQLEAALQLRVQAAKEWEAWAVAARKKVGGQRLGGPCAWIDKEGLNPSAPLDWS